MRNILVNMIGVGVTHQIGMRIWIDIENPTNNTDANLESEKPSQTSFRQPPPGWSESRRKAISKNKTLLESSDNLQIKNCRSDSTEEFNKM